VLEVGQEHVDRAFSIARWYGRQANRAELTDLESAALEGLAKAARDWDPEVPARRRRKDGKPSFWSFACTRILGEMRDELRRFDHLTRKQRSMVAEDASGNLSLEEEGLEFVNPEEPVSLDANLGSDEGETPGPMVDTIEEPRDPIEDLELRDAFSRAGADLRERDRFVIVKREIEGYSNAELADAFDVTEGRASQLRGAALDRMRRQIGDSFLDAA
jgi:RNA polymerase sigma factor (sigma-70 family)